MTADSSAPKYIVFKAEDWNDLKTLFGASNVNLLNTKLIDDAVVIRRQDLFAPAALYGYAHSIGIAIAALKQDKGGYSEEVVRRLQKIMDYFFQEAELATDEAFKLPD